MTTFPHDAPFTLKVLVHLANQPLTTFSSEGSTGLLYYGDVLSEPRRAAEGHGSGGTYIVLGRRQDLLDSYIDTKVVS